jgi:AcrR family transcriptional regulator/DNA-binding MarR family transcriptional regulator
MANAPDARLRVRNAVPGPRGGGLYLSESQRTRLLDAAFAIVCEEGYRGMAVRAVSERAGVSSKTFYDLFEDREGCFLAAFDYGVEQLAEVARPAYEAQRDWAAAIRAGLGALLAFLDDEPALRRVVFVEALGVGPRVLARRAEVLDGLAGLLDEGRESAKETADELPAMTGTGVVGAAFSMIHARLIEQHAEPLVGLLNELMATIVLPYRGREAAARELNHPISKAGPVFVRPMSPATLPAEGFDLMGRPDERSGTRADFRLTVRRHAALSAVAELCARGLEPSNREVCGGVGIADQSQVSRLMMGLERQGLVENTRAGVLGTRKAWRLTPQGQAALDANWGGRASIKKEHRPARRSASVNGRASVRRRVPASRRGSGGKSVPERQRSRLLEATFALVAEDGYRDLTAGLIAARAGVSRRTFYELFGDREDCFLQAFDHALDVLAEQVLPVYETEREWTARVRAGLAALLECLDGEPVLRRLVFVEALPAGPRVLARRVQALDELTAVVDEGRADGLAAEGVPALAAQGIVGAVFGVIYGHLSQRRPEPLIGLLGSLMAIIVLPYRGGAAAEREQRGTWTFSSGRENPAGVKSPARLAERQAAPPIAGLRPLGSALPADFRLTVRTQMALAAVAACSARGVSPSNLEVGRRIGVASKGAVSHLMSRLQEQGLVENTHGRTKGLQKAWRLTQHGEAVLDAHLPAPGRRASNTDEPTELSGGKLVAKRARSAPARPASAGFRLTVRTHLVLTAIAEHTGASNRAIAKAAGVRDEGQISKLLARLQDRGLIRDTANPTSSGHPKSWQLTPQGEALLHAHRPQSSERAA